MRPVPDDGSVSWEIDGQWYTTTYRASRRVPQKDGHVETNREIVKRLMGSGFAATKHGNFIHLTPPDWK